MAANKPCVKTGADWTHEVMQLDMKFRMVGNNCRKKLASCSSVSQQMSGEGSRAVTWDRAVLEAALQHC